MEASGPRIPELTVGVVFFLTLASGGGCNGADSGSNAPFDSGDPSGGDSSGGCDSLWYIDYDGDGHGVDGSFTQTACQAPPGFVETSDDCNDADGSIHPGADEVCDGVDQDCDTIIDDDPVDGSTWYADTDLDGYGDEASSLQACDRPEGYTSDASDPDDADPTTPGVLHGDWPTLGGGPTHAGYFAGAVGTAVLSELWTARMLGALDAPIAVAGIVYVTGGDYSTAGYVAALDADSGAVRWQYDLDEAYSINPPTWYEGQVFMTRGNSSSDTHMWAFDAETGSLNWRSAFTAQWEDYLAPTAADGMVWTNGGTYGGMYGFDTADGSQLFYDQRLEQTSNWTPAYDGSTLYSFCDGNVRGHIPETGVEEWKVTVPGSFYTYEMNTAPVVSDGMIYVVDSEGLFAIDAAGHQLVWTVEGAFSGVPTVANGLVYAISGSGIQAYDKDDGSYSGIYIAGYGISGQAIVTDDIMVVSGGGAAATYVIDLASGNTTDEIPFAGSVAVSDGRLLIATESGILHAYKWISP